MSRGGDSIGLFQICCRISVHLKLLHLKYCSARQWREVIHDKEPFKQNTDPSKDMDCAIFQMKDLNLEVTDGYHHYRMCLCAVQSNEPIQIKR
jgi:hypothetical protein